MSNVKLLDSTVLTGVSDALDRHANSGALKFVALAYDQLIFSKQSA